MNRHDSIFFHIDVNNAFLSWAAVARLQKDPSSVDIRTIPAVIGGDESKRHGIVLAKSVSAKAFGIQTGESLANARKKCPKLQVFPPDFATYVTMSNQFMEYLREVAPLVEQYSIKRARFIDSEHKHMSGGLNKEKRTQS